MLGGNCPVIDVLAQTMRFTGGGAECLPVTEARVGQAALKDARAALQPRHQADRSLSYSPTHGFGRETRTSALVRRMVRTSRRFDLYRRSAMNLLRTVWV